MIKWCKGELFFEVIICREKIYPAIAFADINGVLTVGVMYVFGLHDQKAQWANTQSIAVVLHSSGKNIFFQIPEDER